MRHSHSLRVRYADTDQMRMVYYARYLDYFEVARTEMLRAHGIPYRSFEERGYFLPVLEAHIQYLNSARYDDELIIHTTLEELRGPILHIKYVITCNDKQIATGHTEHAFIRADTGKPCKPPEDFLKKVNPA